MGGRFGGSRPHVHTRLPSLACSLVREGVLFKSKDGSVVFFWGGDFIL